jgi:uncharacterized protein YndB with AHSA1/START domain
MPVSAVVTFPQPPEVVFDYLKDPRNRPQWQSSLRAVDDVVGNGDVGTTWVDVTKPGLRPRLRVTACEPQRLWVEEGVWRGVTARLECHFRESASGGTVLKAVVDVRLPTPLRMAGPLLGAMIPRAMRADLRTAARLIGDR